MEVIWDNLDFCQIFAEIFAKRFAQWWIIPTLRNGDTALYYTLFVDLAVYLTLPSCNYKFFSNSTVLDSQPNADSAVYLTIPSKIHCKVPIWRCFFCLIFRTVQLCRVSYTAESLLLGVSYSSEWWFRGVSYTTRTTDAHFYYIAW